jgi:hypothetical protein
VATSTGREEITIQAITTLNRETLVVLPPEGVVLPLEEYERLVDKAELAASRDEMAAPDVVKRILDDENSIRIWRSRRTISPKHLRSTSTI